jgi:hypothetical protein
LPHRLIEVARGPEGRLLYTRDLGESRQTADMFFQSHLYAVVTRGEISRRQGLRREALDLGSGLVTNVGVLAMANDPQWAAPSGAAATTLKLQNWVATGTGTTAAAATDMTLQTLAAPTTANAVSGTQSLVSAANLQKFQQVTTINYTSTLAITEWGLHSAQVLSATTGTPFTAATANSATVTGTPYTASTASVQGEQQLVVFPGTTLVWGLILSNTTSVLTIPAWYNVSNGAAGSTPGNTETFTLKPVLWDHKVFSAINVNSGDSIQFTYSLTINSGG